jgi:hypothetical protein
VTIIYKDNLPDFKRQMLQAGRDFIPIARAASRAAAVEFAKAIRRTAPKGPTGTLKRAVVIKRMRRVPPGIAGSIVGIRQGKSQQRLQRKRKGKAVTVNLDAFYWRFLEGGWHPRRPGSQLRGGRRTKALQARRAAASGKGKVSHPFIKPAFQGTHGQALSAFYSALNKGVDKLAAKK